MPRLSPMPRPHEPADGYEPCPIDLNWDRKYILDATGTPVRVYDFGAYARWTSWEGKGYQIRDELPERNATVWTYFSGWGSMHDEKPPMFWTCLRAGGINQTFESLTWEEAQEKHERVVEKARRVIPVRPGMSDSA
ncbi:hypothetical protein [Cupriavidus taiwanensis]|uniref:hypothetical protein n=1 Tax=Cupriavidus taiwanensis TaxID=164546 RepID=UPI000E1089D0|nr:hypothetical protein [Cupriavidus taiwanensis]SOY56885.1 conserved hypothetical protein [Cupriavidus taiwanensis]SOY90835.1 conserved hypothetical protein [Cupriavidus taiwanensis]SOZ63634.1 conserved hypothetical protein [Cupriavidus taiwanensis]SOZ82639.1 conserved hypothetical protein [Cupriavidus taiwanensis]SOZ84470.1 conserved hypothetical protein [Cupriavidus taiwanensis]